MLKNGTVICFTIEFPTDRIICTRNDHLCWHGKKKCGITQNSFSQSEAQSHL